MHVIGHDDECERVGQLVPLYLTQYGDDTTPGIKILEKWGASIGGECEVVYLARN